MTDIDLLALYDQSDYYCIQWLLVIGYLRCPERSRRVICYLLFVISNAQCLMPYAQFQSFMTTKFLLTSFNTWQHHQKSNSSDDLLAQVSQMKSLPYSMTYLRKLPVDFQLAPNLVIAQINKLQPDTIICCGMAESRKKLTVESCACHNNKILKTAVNLEHLIADLPTTKISHNAGKFVCESLYYAVLKHLADSQLSTKCIFVHIPILTPENTNQILADFLLILNRLTIDS